MQNTLKRILITLIIIIAEFSITPTQAEKNKHISSKTSMPFLYGFSRHSLLIKYDLDYVNIKDNAVMQAQLSGNFPCQ